jgi:hypothetical protein
MNNPQTLPQQLVMLYGETRAKLVLAEYRALFAKGDLVKTDLAAFCNAAGENAGANEFERGIEEGKRRVWLHIARILGLTVEDFVGYADGSRLL